MSKPDKIADDAYFERAASWADAREDALIRSRRAAWIVAAALAGIGLMEAAALFALVPLKTVVPYTLLVDRQTGFVQALKPAETPLIAADSALARSMLAQYVTAREGFDISDIQIAYRKVGLWSAGAAQRDYAAAMRLGNAAGPLAGLPRTTVVQVHVRSVSPLSAGTAMVRFETVRRDSGQDAAPPRFWVAVVRYRYSQGPMAQDDRFLNPLGFQVTGYRRDAETPLPTDDAVPPTAPAAYGPASPDADHPGVATAASPTALSSIRQTGDRVSDVAVARVAPRDRADLRTAARPDVRMVDPRFVPQGSPLESAALPK